MHPRECFWFDQEEYQVKIENREIGRLLRDAHCKRANITEIDKRINVEILLTILSHGSLLWMVMLSCRSKSVSKDKLVIINNELRRRQGLPHIHRKPFNLTKIDISLEILEVIDKRQTQSNQPTPVTLPEAFDSPGHKVPAIEYEMPPPPYEANLYKPA